MKKSRTKNQEPRTKNQEPRTNKKKLKVYKKNIILRKKKGGTLNDEYISDIIRIFNILEEPIKNNINTRIKTFLQNSENFKYNLKLMFDITNYFQNLKILIDIFNDFKYQNIQNSIKIEHINIIKILNILKSIYYNYEIELNHNKILSLFNQIDIDTQNQILDDLDICDEINCSFRTLDDFLKYIFNYKSFYKILLSYKTNIYVKKIINIVILILINLELENTYDKTYCKSIINNTFTLIDSLSRDNYSILLTDIIEEKDIENNKLILQQFIDNLNDTIKEYNYCSIKSIISLLNQFLENLDNS